MPQKRNSIVKIMDKIPNSLQDYILFKIKTFLRKESIFTELLLFLPPENNNNLKFLSKGFSNLSQALNFLIDKILNAENQNFPDTALWYKLALEMLLKMPDSFSKVINLNQSRLKNILSKDS